MYGVDRVRGQDRIDVVGQHVEAIVALRRLAAAVAAHVDRKAAVARAPYGRKLLGPHAAIGGERMRKTDDRRAARSGEIVADAAAVVLNEHGVMKSFSSIK